MYLKITDCEGLDWINLVQDSGKLQALVNTVIKILVP
jgi:hypothetical protein